MSQPRRQLTAEIVRDIRASHPAESQRQLARRLGFNRRTINHVLTRRTWRHV
jgi:DNA-binding XRE family transcriptional regulator